VRRGNVNKTSPIILGVSMKKFFAVLVLSLASLSSFAEASFEQIEGLIQQKNYAAAASGLETVIQNHPKSAKAFYAMAQAQAGLGNLEKANKALTIAQGLNPTLDFAPADSVQKLKQAITPQTAKIEAVEESHALRNFVYFVLFAGFAVACYFLYSVYSRKKEEEEAAALSEKLAAQAEEHARAELKVKRMQEEREAELARQLREQQAEDALKAHKNYNHERFDPANPDKLKSVAQFKKEQEEAKRVLELREAQARADAAEATARMYRTSAQTVAPTHTTVVNNSSNDMLTGVLIGNMLSGHHDHHETTKVVEREVIREVPAKSSSRDSSWDDTPSTSSSRSSSWDDSSSSSSSRSSSWSDSSSSSSSSSWDSGSSSSDSSSSSSWD